MGNSLLLRFTEKCNEVITLDDKIEPSAKRLKTSDSATENGEDRVLDSLNDCMASDVLDIRDPEELEVYGNQKQASLQITSYVFEVGINKNKNPKLNILNQVCDSLLNIGPCGNISLGEPAFLSEEFSEGIDLDLELVTTAGYGKNGALCVLQKSVRPQIITTFTLPGCSNMWTVHSGDEKHAFLILSQEDGTMVKNKTSKEKLLKCMFQVLQTGDEINEIDNTGFATHIPTVYSGNLGGLKYIVQVTSGAIRLLQGKSNS